MKESDMSERRKILREVIYLAHEGGYDGPGHDWDTAPAPELDKVLEKDAHVAVLKSAEFTRPFFWHILYPEAATIGPGASSEERDAEEMEEIEMQIESLGRDLAEAKDPLEFLKKYLT
jgi:hypothetical protein